MKKIMLLLLVEIFFLSCDEEDVKKQQEALIQEIHLNDIIACYGYSSIESFTNGESRYIKFQNRSDKAIKAFKAEVYIMNDFNEIAFMDLVAFDSATEYNSLNNDPSIEYLYTGSLFSYTFCANEFLHFYTSDIYGINDSIFTDSLITTLFKNGELKAFASTCVNMQYLITDVVFSDGTVYSVEGQN